MDAPYMPVKESVTAAGPRPLALCSDWIRVIFGIFIKYCKPFMSKHLHSTSPLPCPGRKARPIRVAGARPNPYHRFLRRLSTGGRTNMYGAIPYLMQAFTLDRETAFRIVCDWVDQQQAEPAPGSDGASPRR